jgi:hypothetical protein
MSLVCDGRPVRRFDNQPAGESCGATYPGRVESARVAGWRVGPPRPDGSRPTMCPACARPGATEETPGAAILEPLPGL